jgi:energy-coupling factor transport system permease protein
MKSISLFVDNGSWLTRLHPFTKVLYIVTAIAVTVLSGRLSVYGVFLVLSMAILASGKVLKKAFPLLAFSFTILLTILIIHGLFHSTNATLLVAIGPAKFYREGVLYAVHIGANVLNMLLSFAILVLATKPEDLVEQMEKAGFSPKFAYIVNAVFQILPQMMGTMNTISDAQRSRGMETEGKLSVRIRAFLPLISPVVSSSLINTRERAIALEVRGFGRKGKRTYLKKEPPLAASKWINLVLFLLLAAAIVAKIVSLIGIF